MIDNGAWIGLVFVFVNFLILWSFFYYLMLCNVKI